MYTDVLNESVILTLRPGTSLQSSSLFTTAARRKRRRRRRSRSLFWGHAQSLHTPLSCPSVRLSSCLPACLSFTVVKLLCVNFPFPSPECLFSEILDYIQLMFFTTSTTSSSSSATDSKLFLLLLEFFFFSNRFKTISSSSSSSSTSILLLQQQIQNYFFLNSSSSTTDSKLFLLLQQTDSKLLNSSSSAFKSNLQLFTGLPIFFKHVPNFANNFNYSKK
jgi:hypothetical protein